MKLCDWESIGEPCRLNWAVLAALLQVAGTDTISALRSHPFYEASKVHIPK